MGLALFLPPVRDLVWRALRRRITVTTAPGYGARPPVRPHVVDLTDGEFARRADGSSPGFSWSATSPSAAPTDRTASPTTSRRCTERTRLPLFETKRKGADHRPFLFSHPAPW